MTAPSVHIDWDARLLPFTDGSERAAVVPSSWFITFGFGKPAASTYTEVMFTQEAVASLPADWDEHSRERVLDEVTRAVALSLYGSVWSFHYRPEEYADAIERHGLRRRERVAVTSLEVSP